MVHDSVSPGEECGAEVPRQPCHARLRDDEAMDVLSSDDAWNAARSHVDVSNERPPLRTGRILLVGILAQFRGGRWYLADDGRLRLSMTATQPLRSSRRSRSLLAGLEDSDRGLLANLRTADPLRLATFSMRR